MVMLQKFIHKLSMAIYARNYQKTISFKNECLIIMQNLYVLNLVDVSILAVNCLFIITNVLPPIILNNFN